jgi:hypothetical protein
MTTRPDTIRIPGYIFPLFMIFAMIVTSLPIFFYTTEEVRIDLPDISREQICAVCSGNPDGRIWPHGCHEYYATGEDYCELDSEWKHTAIVKIRGSEDEQRLIGDWLESLGIEDYRIRFQ